VSGAGTHTKEQGGGGGENRGENGVGTEEEMDGVKKEEREKRPARKRRGP